MNEPGGLDELSAAGRAAWTRRVEECIVEVLTDLGLDSPHRFVLAAPDTRTRHRTAVDWPGLPLRPVECLTRHQALALLDWTPSGGEGRIRRLQEEYVEWLVVSDDVGIRRVELTTELSDYWRVLAAFDPQRTLDLVASFAGQPSVDPQAVYRGCDPFSSSSTPEEREAAFAGAMLTDGESSPYNDGRAAITCMAQWSNTLRALAQLVFVATNPRVAQDPLSGRIRCLTCDEAIPLMDGAAQAGRASDPVLVERLGRLAYEGRLVAFDDPLGVYIQSVESTRLRTPDDEPVPGDWFTFERGLAPSQTTDGRPRWQRLTFEPSADSGLRVSDLLDLATEQPIGHGGQVADLVQVALVLRVSDTDVEPPGTLEPTELAQAGAEDARRCPDIRREWDDYLAQVGQ